MARSKFVGGSKRKDESAATQCGPSAARDRQGRNRTRAG